MDEEKVVKKPVSPKTDPSAKAEYITAKKVEREEFVSELMADIGAAIKDRETWKTRQERWMKKRFGIRPKKTFPWTNCSNLHIPLGDTHIRMMKPSYVNLTTIEPVCNFYSDLMPLEQIGDEVEPTYHWIWNTLMDDQFVQTNLTVDWMLERGFSIVKVINKFNSNIKDTVISIADLPDEVKEMMIDPSFDDMQLAQLLAPMYNVDVEDDQEFEPMLRAIIDARMRGSESISFSRVVVTDNRPQILAFKPEEIVVPANTTDLQNAEWICCIYRLSDRQLKMMAYNGILKWSGVKKLIEKGSEANDENEVDEIQRDFYTKKGIDKKDKDPKGYHTIYEISCYYDNNNDGIPEKCVLVYPRGQAKSEFELSAKKLPYDDQKWPFVKVYTDVIGRGHYDSRGIMERIDPYQTAITAMVNNKLDRLSLSTSPVVKYIPTAVKWANVKWIPGQGIPTTRMDAIDAFTMPDTTVRLDQQENMLKQMAEEYLGSFNTAIVSGNQGQDRPRTKTEINAIQSAQGDIFSLDSRVFQDCMRKVHEMVWSRYLQYGDDKMLIQKMGSMEKFMVLKQKFNGRFLIAPAGNAQNSNPQQERQQALQNYSLFGSNPYHNSYALLENVWNKLDPKQKQKVLLPKEEAEENMQRQQQAQTMLELMKAGRSMDLTGQKQTGQVASQVFQGT